MKISTAAVVLTLLFSTQAPAFAVNSTFEDEVLPTQIQEFTQEAKAQGYTDSEIKEITDSVKNSENQIYLYSSYKPNGCSDPLPGNSFKTIFKQACDAHDYCYSAEHNRGRSRQQCDDKFLGAMQRICDGRYTSAKRTVCRREATLWHLAVRKFGKSHFKGSGNPS